MLMISVEEAVLLRAGHIVESMRALRDREGIKMGEARDMIQAYENKHKRNCPNCGGNHYRPKCSYCGGKGFIWGIDIKA